MKLKLIAFFFYQLTLFNNVFGKIHSFAIIGDAGHWNSKAKTVRNSILKSGVNKLILPGDNLYYPQYSYDDIWSHWSKHQLHFSLVAIGNHYKTYEEEINFFKMPAEYYEKVYHQTRFLILNSDNPSNIKQQFLWMQERLKENYLYKFNFIILHHPPVTISHRHHWEERKRFHEYIRPLLIKYQDSIAALIVGHDHIASLLTLDNLPIIVSGAVFESIPSHKVDYYFAGRYRVKTRWINKKDYYWVRLDINEESQDIWVNFMHAGKNKSNCAINISKKIAPQHWYCKK